MIGVKSFTLLWTVPDHKKDKEGDKLMNSLTHSMDSLQKEIFLNAPLQDLLVQLYATEINNGCAGGEPDAESQCQLGSLKDLLVSIKAGELALSCVEEESQRSSSNLDMPKINASLKLDRLRVMLPTCLADWKNMVLCRRLIKKVIDLK
jgi:hypothetical protein